MTCKYCLAAWGDIDHPDCATNHQRVSVVQLAYRLAETHFCEIGQRPTDEQIGWFLEDAVEGVAELGHLRDYVVTKAGYESRGSDGGCALISINGVLFECREGPMYPYDPSLYEDEDDLDS